MITAASRALFQGQPGWVNPIDTIWDLDFTEAPAAEQRQPPAVGYTHPHSTATAYLHPREDAYQDASWSVHGPDDAWVVTLAPGITGTMIAAILGATYRARDLTAGREPLAWTDARIALDGRGVYPCQLGRLTAHGPVVPRFNRAAMNRIVEDWHTLHLDHAADGAPQKIWDLAWNGENVAVRIFRADTRDEHGDPEPDLYSSEPDDEGFYYFGAGLLDWQTVEAP